MTNLPRPAPAPAAAAFNATQLSQIFPFHFALDGDLRIVAMGRGLRKLLPQATLGVGMAEHFTLKSPRLELTYQTLQQAAASLVVLSGREGAPVLKGEFVDLGDSLLFIGVPAVDSLQAVQALGLKITDFPHHVTTTDLLLLLQTQKLMNADMQRLAAANAREIEERRHAEEELQRAVLETQNALRSQARFFNTLSHEIRTPLHAILGWLSALAELVAHETQAAEMVAMAREAGEALQRQLGDILDFADMDAGRLGLEYGAFELAPMLQSVRTVMEPAARARGVQFELQEARSLPTVALIGDDKRIQQILLSLAEHAVNTDTRGSVTLCATAMRAAQGADALWQLCFTVEHGVGSVASERRAQIASGSGTSEVYAAGASGSAVLDIEVARQLATMMGGRLTLEPRSDRAQRIRVELELREDGSTPTAATSPAAAARPGAALNVLVVDDVAVNRKLLRYILERAGCRVDERSDGVEALAAVSSSEYDLVLMDVSMPRMDGLAATRAIRAQGGPGGSVPIVAVTAHALRGDREACLAAGMDDYLAKPFDTSKLMAMVATWTAASRPSTRETPRMSEKSSENEPIVDREILAQLARDTDPAMVPELLGIFLADARDRLSRIEAAIDSADGAAVQADAHTLGSSAGTFGLPGLHRLARSCEEALRGGDVERGLGLGRQLTAAGPAALDALARYAEEIGGG